jgi:hypothetical protein
MGIPDTVAVGFEILTAVRGGDAARASRCATKAGARRLTRILATPADPRAERMRAWESTAQSRVKGSRALCRFGELGDGRLVALELRLVKGLWRLDDVLLLERDAYDEYGSIDEGPSSR